MAGALDPRIQEVVERLALAVTRFLGAWLQANDDAEQEVALQAVTEAFRTAVIELTDDERQAIGNAFVPLTRLGFNLADSQADLAVREAEGILREGFLEQLHEQFNTGGAN